MAAEADEDEIDGKCHPLCACKSCSSIAESPKKTKDVILTKPFNINAVDSEGYSALHVAARYNHVELIKILLDNGAKINLKSNAGETPLHVACGHRKFNAIKTLLTLSQVDIIDLKDNNGETVLFHAVKTDNLPLVNLLLLHEPNPKLRNLNGELAIDVAKKKFFLAVVKVLEKS